MKKVFLGMLLGIVLCGAGLAVAYPGIERKAYEEGYAAGNKDGNATGITTGIAQGVAQVNAIIKARQDSLDAATARAAEKRRAAGRKKAKPPVQNWHVVDGRIGDPVEE